MASFTACLETSITFAHTRLQRARAGREETQIRYWNARLDELLDEYLARQALSTAQGEA